MKHHLEIKSDGIMAHTHILLDGKELSTVSKLTLTMEGDKFVRGTITLVAPDLDLDAGIYEFTKKEEKK